MCAEAQTLKHGALLLKRVIVALAAAEAISEVVVVLVVRVWILGVHAVLGVGGWVDTQIAGARRRKPRRAAVAGEIPLVEDLNEGMFAVALDGARVAHSGGVVRIGLVLRRGVARQTCEDALAEGAEWLGTALYTLLHVSLMSHKQHS